MEKTAQQPARGSVEKRDSVLSALLLNNAGKATFNDLQKVFTFDEIRALKDPSQALPDGLPKLTPVEHRTIARSLAAGPPETSKKSGSSRFEPDPRYDGRALQLACAITERVDARDPVHGRNLVVDIRALLRASDAALKTLPRDKLVKATQELTRARVTLDAKLDLAARLHGEKFDKPLFMRNVGRRNPKPGHRFGHPLGFAPREAREAYDRDVDRVVERALSDRPKPTLAEVSVAGISLLPDPPKQAAHLIAPLKQVFEDGALREVDDLMKDRAVLLDEIADTTASPKTSEAILERLFRSFTRKEIWALAQPDKRLPGTVPALDETRRAEVARGLTTITKTKLRVPKVYAWGLASKTLEHGLHPERAARAARARSRGRGASLS